MLYGNITVWPLFCIERSYLNFQITSSIDWLYHLSSTGTILEIPIWDSNSYFFPNYRQPRPWRGARGAAAPGPRFQEAPPEYILLLDLVVQLEFQSTVFVLFRTHASLKPTNHDRGGGIWPSASASASAVPCAMPQLSLSAVRRRPMRRQDGPTLMFLLLIRFYLLSLSL